MADGAGRADAARTGILDLDRFARAEAPGAPFEYFTVPGFVRAEAFEAVRRDFPELPVAGSVPLAGLRYGEAFGRLIDELRGPALRAVIERKFGLDLGGRPVMVTLRGHVRERDGRIHTDSRDKLITMLIYMNERWDAPGGRLRLLRSGDDLEDYAEEVVPAAGNMLVFRRSERSFHGHLPAVGERRSIQINWLVSDGVKRREEFRHRLSGLFRFGRKRART